jgi:rhodanese-related sulfurtransferase
MLEWAILSYIRRKFADVNHLSTDEFDTRTKFTSNDAKISQDNEHSNSAYVTIDCRRKDEFEVSHIPNSKHLHFQTDDASLINFLVDERNKLLNTDSASKELNVVCYCSLGYRSSTLAQRIEQIKSSDANLSDKNIRAWNLDGSIFKWANEKRPMTDINDMATKFVHPFSYTFCMLLEREYWKWTPDSKQDT